MWHVPGKKQCTGYHRRGRAKTSHGTRASSELGDIIPFRNKFQDDFLQLPQAIRDAPGDTGNQVGEKGVVWNFPHRLPLWHRPLDEFDVSELPDRKLQLHIGRLLCIEIEAVEVHGKTGRTPEGGMRCPR